MSREMEKEGATAKGGGGLERGNGVREGYILMYNSHLERHASTAIG